jgi:hypothetical protein
MLKRIHLGLLAFVIGGGVAAAQTKVETDADTREIASYRLTMEGVQKLTLAMRSVMQEMQKDPKYQELAKVKADIKALEDKDERTEADDERLASLQEKEDQIEDSLGGGLDFGEEKTLSDMEARVKQSDMLMRGLRTAALSPREYVKLSLSLITSAMYAGMKKSGLLKELPKEASPENVQFVLDHEAELAAWQKEMQAFGKEKQ